MESEYIEISSYAGIGYQPMIDYQSWRVAILRYHEELEVPNLMTMQKHDETDEVFVLLDGNCTLFVGGKGDEIGEISGVAMEQLKLYNVKKGVWHTHTLDKAATVLIIENQDTSDQNSPTKAMNEGQIVQLREVFQKVSPKLTYN
ncbi:MAG: hypothetical protein GX359_05715 [Clostridiales bacterium]|nr:hypothetical protein [Clostridiales bacterium]